jgi:hypothetical protein
MRLTRLSPARQTPALQDQLNRNSEVSVTLDQLNTLLAQAAGGQKTPAEVWNSTFYLPSLPLGRLSIGVTDFSTQTSASTKTISR